MSVLKRCVYKSSTLHLIEADQETSKALNTCSSLKKKWIHSYTSWTLPVWTLKHLPSQVCKHFIVYRIIRVCVCVCVCVIVADCAGRLPQTPYLLHVRHILYHFAKEVNPPARPVRTHCLHRTALLHIYILYTDVIPDLRHKLEKQKVRKLSKEEKKTFFAKVKTFIAELIQDNSNAAKEKNKGNSKLSSPNVQNQLQPKAVEGRTKVAPESKIIPELNNNHPSPATVTPVKPRRQLPDFTSQSTARATAARVIAVPGNSPLPDLSASPKALTTHR